MVRLEFDIPDYAGGLALGIGGGLGRRVALALASAHARAVEGEAKRRAPVRTGRLRNSIRAYLSGAGRGVLEATAPYARYLHEGTGIYGPARKPIVIEPRGKKALWWPGAAHPVRVVRQAGIKPRDFLRLAGRRHFASLRTLAAGLGRSLVQEAQGLYSKFREQYHYSGIQWGGVLGIISAEGGGNYTTTYSLTTPQAGAGGRLVFSRQPLNNDSGISEAPPLDITLGYKFMGITFAHDLSSFSLNIGLARGISPYLNMSATMYQTNWLEFWGNVESELRLLGMGEQI